jgi:UTP--glucose-1-phosphate uridylyltransferase
MHGLYKKHKTKKGIIMINAPTLRHIICAGLLYTVTPTHSEPANKTTNNKKRNTIEQVVVPAAGLGTRFLPFTKAVAKEMLPILERPAIEYTLEETIQSGIHHLICITSDKKTTLHEHLNAHADIKNELKKKEKAHLITRTEQLINDITIDYVMQHEQKGLGHAILQAEQNIKSGQSFGVILADDIIVGSEPEIRNVIRIAEEYDACVVAVQEVPYNAVSQYGVVSIENTMAPGTHKVNGLVEKPDQADAPSNLAIAGRYVLPHRIFDILKETLPLKNNEIQITDAIQSLIDEGFPVIAYQIQGKRYDIGTPLGWCKTVLDFACNHPTYGAQIRAHT